MRILLFGKRGQVGAATEAALASNCELISIDRKGIDELSGDLSLPKTLSKTIRSIQPSIVINAAAFTDVEAAESSTRMAQTVNAEAPLQMAITCREIGALLVHFSTDYVFDGGGRTAWREADHPMPINSYGRTKLAGEEAIRISGCRSIIIRTSWVFAERGRNFIRTMLRLSLEREQLKVVNDQWGAPTSADLIAKVTHDLIELECGGRNLEGTYHLTASGETTWYEYAKLVIDRARRSGWPVKVAPNDLIPVDSDSANYAARRPKNSRLDCSKLEGVIARELPRWEDDVERVVDNFIEKGTDEV